MSRSSTTLMSDTSQYWNKTGEKIRADGFYGSSDGLHTLSIYVGNFIGRVYIEASIAENPTATDWFAIPFDGATLDHVEYPHVGALLNPNGETSVLGFNLTANITWIRSRLDRTYLGIPEPVPSDFALYGAISKILMSH